MSRDKDFSRQSKEDLDPDMERYSGSGLLLPRRNNRRNKIKRVEGASAVISTQPLLSAEVPPVIIFTDGGPAHNEAVVLLSHDTLEEKQENNTVPIASSPLSVMTPEETLIPSVESVSTSSVVIQKPLIADEVEEHIQKEHVDGSQSLVMELSEPIPDVSVPVLQDTVSLRIIEKDKREKAVAEARKKFVEEDYKNSTLHKKLGAFFRFKKQEMEEHVDVQYWKNEYKRTLQSLQEMKLEDIKEQKGTGEETKEALAETLLFFKHEALRLYQEYTQVREQHAGWIGKVANMTTKIGTGYNQLSFQQKMLLSGALLIGGVATGGMSIVAKRMLAGTGSFVGIEGALQKWFDAREVKRVDNDIQTRMQAEQHSFVDGGNATLQYETLRHVTHTAIEELDTRLQQKKWENMLRKTIATGIAVGIGSGMFSHMVTGYLHGTETVSELGRPVGNVLMGQTDTMLDIVDHQASPLMVTSDGMQIPWDGTDIDRTLSSQDALKVQTQKMLDVLEKHTPHDVLSAHQIPSASNHLEEIMPKVSLSTLLQDYVLTRADGSRGLWGIIDAQLPTELAREERHAIIQKIENVIAERLQDMSPEERKLAGFPTGNINQIYADDTLRLGTLLTENDIHAIVRESASFPSDSVLSVGAEAGLTGGVITDPPLMDLDIRLDRDIHLGKAYDIQAYKEYLVKHPEDFPVFKKMSAEYVDFIFQGNMQEMGRMGSLTLHELTPTDIQQTKLAEFFRLSREAFGPKLGLPGKQEKMYEYMMRMAMLGIEHPTGKRVFIPKWM